MPSHLSLDDRIQIQLLLDNGSAISQIAKNLGKDRSTISREIQKHRQKSDMGAFGYVSNRCLSRRSCKLFGLCPDKPDCTRRCASCSLCNNFCPQFQEEHCSRLESTPYVCNGCTERRKCTLRKFFYDAKTADRDYRNMLSGCREGFNLSTGELQSIDATVSPLIKNGQSVHNIYINNADSLAVGERTIQRLLHSNMLTASILDQPRVCMLKPRKSGKRERKIDKACRVGRTYEDFCKFMTDHPAVHEVEMDSVIGRIGGKVLLTLIFPSSELMLAFLRERNTAQSVIERISFLYEHLGSKNFHYLFPVLLTDNGSEFSDPIAIEQAPDRTERTRIFYCDAMASYQKPHVERNHEFIRRILPKGSSFDDLTQEDINLLLSHINSYARASLGDKSPFQVFAYQYGRELTDNLLRLLCLKEIPANEIMLKPKLLRK